METISTIAALGCTTDLDSGRDAIITEMLAIIDSLGLKFEYDDGRDKFANSIKNPESSGWAGYIDVRFGEKLPGETLDAVGWRNEIKVHMEFRLLSSRARVKIAETGEFVSCFKPEFKVAWPAEGSREPAYTKEFIRVLTNVNGLATSLERQFGDQTYFYVDFTKEQAEELERQNKEANERRERNALFNKLINDHASRMRVTSDPRYVPVDHTLPIGKYEVPLFGTNKSFEVFVADPRGVLIQRVK